MLIQMLYMYILYIRYIENNCKFSCLPMNISLDPPLPLLWQVNLIGYLSCLNNQLLKTRIFHFLFHGLASEWHAYSDILYLFLR